MEDALDGHEETVSIGGRTVVNLRFVDDLDGLAGKEEELVSLVKRLDSTSTAYDLCADYCCMLIHYSPASL